MVPILLHMTAAACYIGLAAYSWRNRHSRLAFDRPMRQPSAWERFWLLLALIVHGITLGQGIFPPSGMVFSFAIAISLIIWLAIALYWIESFYAPIQGLQMLGLPVASLAVLLPLAFPAHHVLINASTSQFRIHFLMAMLAYSLFTLAALHAILMAIAETRLHRGRLTPLLVGLPPLLTMEALLFRLIHLAFFLLTLTLGSGILFSETLFGKAATFNHKTVFAVLSWVIFAALLSGRHVYGWRGRKALRWTLAGFITLVLAYVGSRFVLEIVLGRLY